MSASPPFFRFALVALPVGLVIGGAVSMVFYLAERGESKTKDVGARLGRPVEEERLERDVRILSERIGARHLGRGGKLVEAARYIESTLGPSNAGYEVRRDEYKAAGEEVYNLEVEVEGGELAEEIVVVGAHYDTVSGTPGAGDNASGVAGMLALAQAFVGKKPERTLRFVAFVNEEPPYFQTPAMGSRVYAKGCKRRGEKIVAMLSLDSIGYFSGAEGSQKFPEPLGEIYPKKGDFIAFVSNLESRPLVEKVTGLFQHHSGFPSVGDALPGAIEGVGWSDHWSFWEEGYPAVLVTDTAVFRNPHYHKPGDVVGTLDFPRMAEVVVGLERVVHDLANPSLAPATGYRSRAMERLGSAGAGVGGGK